MGRLAARLDVTTPGFRICETTRDVSVLMQGLCKDQSFLYALRADSTQQDRFVMWLDSAVNEYLESGVVVGSHGNYISLTLKTLQENNCCIEANCQLDVDRLKT